MLVLMAKPDKKPNEIPSAPDKPEVNPPEEVPTRTWPEKNPEIPSEKEQGKIKPPNEIPSPLE
jgi:hypothetical protein